MSIMLRERPAAVPAVSITVARAVRDASDASVRYLDFDATRRAIARSARCTKWEPAWREVCFLRLYVYDVLRGLAALVRWAEKTRSDLPSDAIATVTEDLCARFPDGVVTAGRRSYADRTTRAPDPYGVWTRQPTSTFALLDAVRVVGAPSPWLTRSWAETHAGLLRAIDEGRLVN